MKTYFEEMTFKRWPIKKKHLNLSKFLRIKNIDSVQPIFIVDAELGSVLTTVSANDVDTNPALTYSFVDEDMDDTFAIDRFSGRIVLKRHLDYESRQEYGLKISASDTSHIAYTTLSIRVTDVNDNPPLFQQPAYHINFPG